MDQNSQNSGNSPQEEKPFAQVFVMGIILHLLVPGIISAFFVHSIHLGFSFMGFILCLVASAFFIFLLRVWFVFMMIKWVIMLIPNLIRFLFSGGKNKKVGEDLDNLDEAGEKAERSFMGYLFLPTHLFCTSSVFFIASHWILSGTQEQVMGYVVTGVVYSFITFWAQRNGFLDYILDE